MFQTDDLKEGVHFYARDHSVEEAAHSPLNEQRKSQSLSHSPSPFSFVSLALCSQEGQPFSSAMWHLDSLGSIPAGKAQSASWASHWTTKSDKHRGEVFKKPIMAGGLKPCSQISLIGNKTDIKAKTNQSNKASSVGFLFFFFFSSFGSKWGDKGIFIIPFPQPQQIKWVNTWKASITVSGTLSVSVNVNYFFEAGPCSFWNYRPGGVQSGGVWRMYYCVAGALQTSLK